MQETKLTIRVPRNLLENAPIVKRLSGMLSPDVSIDDYKQHLQVKYGTKD